MTPSSVSPVVTKRQSAIISLRAKATIIVLRVPRRLSAVRAVPQCQCAVLLKQQKSPGELDHAAADPGVAGPCSRQGQVWRALVPAAWRLVAVWPKFKARTAGWYQPASPALAHGKRPVCVVARAVATAPMRANGVVRLTCRDQRSPKRMRDHTAATTFRHSLVASARTIRSVDRETRWR